MDYTALKAELSNLAYQGLSDAQVASAISASTVDVVGPISALDVKKLWARRMILAKCFILSGDVEVPVELRVLLRATYDNLMHDLFADLDPRDDTQAPDIKKYLDGLVLAGAMTDEDRADTLALATVTEAKAVSLDCSELVGMDVPSIIAHMKVARGLGQ